MGVVVSGACPGVFETPLLPAARHTLAGEACLEVTGLPLELLSWERADVVVDGAVVKMSISDPRNGTECRVYW